MVIHAIGASVDLRDAKPDKMAQRGFDQRREKIGVDRHHPLYGVWRDLPVG
jgi:hypothetical protein